MRTEVIFFINGTEHRAGGEGVFETLSRYLRYEQRATGTKIVCEEGDCGACTVLIGRREGDRLSRYVHIATGNYNPTTARQYTDLGLLTSDEAIGNDATSLFNFLTGYSQQTDYERLMVAPVNLRERLVELVRREAANAEAGKPAKIILKCNSLTDTELIEELYAASNNGAEIELIVRGVCALRPGVPGLSENIRVRSIVGRFLEHSRIFYFANADDVEEIYIGSADWMQRNLDRRVEVVVPILDPEIREYLRDEVLGSYLKDTENASVLKADGTYQKVSNGSTPFDAQLYFVGTDILA